MKHLLTLTLTLLTAMTLFVVDAEAKRFGGGKSFGKQYSTTPKQPAATSQTTTSSPTSSALAGKSGASRWLGPLAGLAAGGLLASLLFGDGLGQGRFPGYP